MSTLIEMQSSEEVDLVLAAQRGSREAFGELVRRYQRDVRQFLTRFLFDRSLVDDLAQEVFLAAAMGIDSLQTGRSVRAWLLAIARNKAIDALRSKSLNRVTVTEDVEGLLADRHWQRLAASEALASQRDELTIALRHCIQHLSDRSQRLISWFYYDRISAETIAMELNQKAGSVRMALLRIRRELAKCIRRQVDAQDSGFKDSGVKDSRWKHSIAPNDSKRRPENE